MTVRSTPESTGSLKVPLAGISLITHSKLLLGLPSGSLVPADKSIVTKFSAPPVWVIVAFTSDVTGGWFWLESIIVIVSVVPSVNVNTIVSEPSGEPPLFVLSLKSLETVNCKGTVVALLKSRVAVVFPVPISVGHVVKSASTAVLPTRSRDVVPPVTLAWIVTFIVSPSLNSNGLGVAPLLSVTKIVNVWAGGAVVVVPVAVDWSVIVDPLFEYPAGTVISTS